MPRKSRQKREKRPGLESWLKYQLNPFRIFGRSSRDPWSNEEALAFYSQNKSIIDREARERGKTEVLEDWKEYARKGFRE